MISKNQIKYIQSLHSKKNREQEGVFIIEGVKLVSEFVEHTKFEIKQLFATASYIESHIQKLTKHSINFCEITEDDLKKISLQSNPNQVLALVTNLEQRLIETTLANSVTLYLDDIRDPGNLGTIIRIADWFGIQQIICSPNCTELYNPKTLQASMGAVLRVNVCTMAFTDLILKLNSVPIYGAVLQGETIYKATLKNGLLVIGNEANGISDEILNLITNRITIPAASNNGSESLNAANACAIICAEFHRQLTYS